MWFLYENDRDLPPFDPNGISLKWYLEIFSKELSEQQKGFHCTLKYNEVIYIPSMWYHATLNVGETVFMSVFV